MKNVLFDHKYMYVHYILENVNINRSGDYYYIEYSHVLKRKKHYKII